MNSWFELNLDFRVEIQTFNCLYRKQQQTIAVLKMSGKNYVGIILTNCKWLHIIWNWIYTKHDSFIWQFTKYSDRL